MFAESTTNALPYLPACGLGITTNCFRKSPISAFTQPNGMYLIRGLPVDSYIVTAEPVDLPLTSDMNRGTEFNRTI